MANRNPSVDIAKFVAAIFVIGIHTRPLSDISEIADFFLCDIIFRTAVPFFAVCTGYYISKKIRSNGYEPILRMAFRVLLLYVGWSLFYLIILSFSWKKSGYLSINSYVGWCKSFLIGGSYFHLWYLAQLFWALLLFCPIVKYVPDKYRIILAAILWIIDVFVYVYSDILGVGSSFVHFYYYTGAITGSAGRLLPLLLIGNLIATRQIRSKIIVRFGSFICFLGLVLEVLLINNLGAERFSYVLFTFPLSGFVFMSVIGIDTSGHYNTRVLSKVSMNIYMIHPAVIFICGLLNIKSPFLLFWVTTLVSSFLCVSYELLKKNSYYSCSFRS